MTDDELRKLAERVTKLPRPPEHLAALWDLGTGVLRLLEERDTWKERADALLDQETTPPHVWKAQQTVIEATKRWVLTDEDYDSRHIDDAIRELLVAERG
jgi:hypothetical protein